jgi:hypothetical protein
MPVFYHGVILVEISAYETAYERGTFGVRVEMAHLRQARVEMAHLRQNGTFAPS